MYDTNRQFLRKVTEVGGGKYLSFFDIRNWFPSRSIAQAYLRNPIATKVNTEGYPLFDRISSGAWRMSKEAGEDLITHGMLPAHAELDLEVLGIEPVGDACRVFQVSLTHQT